MLKCFLLHGFLPLEMSTDRVQNLTLHLVFHSLWHIWMKFIRYLVHVYSINEPRNCHFFWFKIMNHLVINRGRTELLNHSVYSINSPHIYLWLNLIFQTTFVLSCQFYKCAAVMDKVYASMIFMIWRSVRSTRQNHVISEAISQYYPLTA